MKQIEDRFQDFAERLLRSDSRPEEADHMTISDFYSLCRLRAEQVVSPQSDLTLKGYMPGGPLTIDQEERLEKNGSLFLRGTALPGRQVAGIRIRKLLRCMCPHKTLWAVVHTSDQEFVAPDSFGPQGIIPLTPRTCLVANNQSGFISREDVSVINQLAVQVSESYYFARSLEACGMSTNAA